MYGLLSKILPMILSLALSQFIYFKIDKKYGVTNKISLKLRMRQEWKPTFCAGIGLVFPLVLGIMGVYVIEIPTTVYFILSGIFTGIGISISNKITIEKNI